MSAPISARRSMPPPRVSNASPNTCAASTGLRPRRVALRTRSREVVLPRQVSMYLARQLTQQSLVRIGQYFGGRDHKTVQHACRKVEAAMKKDAALSGTVRQTASRARVVVGRVEQRETHHRAGNGGPHVVRPTLRSHGGKRVAGPMMACRRPVIRFGNRSPYRHGINGRHQTATPGQQRTNGFSPGWRQSQTMSQTPLVSRMDGASNRRCPDITTNTGFNKYRNRKRTIA